MKTFAEKLVARDFKKRFIAIAIAAAVMLVISAVSIFALCHTQFSELIAAENEHTQTESIENADGEHGEHGEDHENHISVTPLPVSSIVLLCIVAALDAALALFYWISVIEWLYKAAVKNSLNRALWPILGCFTNLIAVLILLIVINDPGRLSGERRV